MLLFFISLILLLIVNWIVLRKLKNNYPKALSGYGNPSGLWNNTNNASFTFGYIGLIQYRSEKLDPKTKAWCTLLFVLCWFFIFIACFTFYQTWSRYI